MVSKKLNKSLKSFKKTLKKKLFKKTLKKKLLKKRKIQKGGAAAAEIFTLNIIGAEKIIETDQLKPIKNVEEANEFLKILFGAKNVEVIPLDDKRYKIADLLDIILKDFKRDSEGDPEGDSEGPNVNMIYCRPLIDENDPRAGIKTFSARRNLDSKKRIMEHFKTSSTENPDFSDKMTVYIVRGHGSARKNGETSNTDEKFKGKFSFFHINAKLGWVSRMLDTTVYLERFLLRYLDKKTYIDVKDTDVYLTHPNITKVTFTNYTYENEKKNYEHNTQSDNNNKNENSESTTQPIPIEIFYNEEFEEFEEKPKEEEDNSGVKRAAAAEEEPAKIMRTKF